MLVIGIGAIAFKVITLIIFLTWVGCFIMLNTNYQFSKYLSSSAGYYDFAVNSLRKKWGIITGWIFIEMIC